MSNELQKSPASSLRASDEMADMFADLPEMDLLTLKKDQVAIQLAALMSYAGRTRTSMADSLGWKKSRVSRVLSGNGNPTVKTIFEFCSVLDYDFDLVFRKPNESRANQPWQSSQTLPQPNWFLSISAPIQFTNELQSPGGVLRDVKSNNLGHVYVKLTASTPSEVRNFAIHSLNKPSEQLEISVNDLQLINPTKSSQFLEATK